MAFSVPDLAYAFDALEPHIDARTMEIHHDKHHAAYVNNLNAALEGTPWAEQSLDAVLTSLDSIPEDKRMAVRNNGGGHANHTLFWEIMGPNGGGDPSGALGDAIADTFGGVADLKAAVNDAGVKRFGSGWTWLVWDGTGLAVKSTPNQDTPVMDGQAPLLGIDVWEHAYYLNYQNRRPDYLEAWWNVVDWNAVAARFDAARGRAAAIRSGSRRRSTPHMATSLAIRVGSACAGPGIIRRVELPQPTDGQLIVRVADGDRGAFDELHGRYARAVLALALRRLGDRGRAEDAMQDAFVAIWRSARTYDPSRGRGAPWLYAVARTPSPTGSAARPSPWPSSRTGRDASPTRPTRRRHPGRPGASTARSRCSPTTSDR